MNKILTWFTWWFWRRWYIWYWFLKIRKYVRIYERHFIKIVKLPIETLFPALNEIGIDRRKLLNDLLARAWEIRNFEIELYWKRATFFWVFIAASFAGYFTVMDPKYDDQPDLRLLVSCFGFIVSYSWYFVNRGSKYWQENWEAKISRIEEELGTTLNNLQFQHGKDRNDWKKIFGRRQYSVTSITIIISFFTCLLWGYLIYNCGYLPCLKSYTVDIDATILFILTLIIAIIIYFKKDSIKKDHEHRFLL